MRCDIAAMCRDRVPTQHNTRVTAGQHNRTLNARRPNAIRVGILVCRPYPSRVIKNKTSFAQTSLQNHGVRIVDLLSTTGRLCASFGLLCAR